jgi:tRNA (cmo5U34)-methyltransferase
VMKGSRLVISSLSVAGESAFPFGEGIEGCSGADVHSPATCRKTQEIQMARAKPESPKFRVPEDWTFKSRHVVENFDAHVRSQLPWYCLATGIVAHFARSYAPQCGVVVDVGASTGNVGRALAPVIEARKLRLIAVDAAAEMKEAYRGPGEFIVSDAQSFDFSKARPHVIICFLSLMFVPVHERAGLVARMKDSLWPGGAIIAFDKTEPRAGYLGTVNYRLALAAKHENGETAEDVIRKELSISGVQRPIRPGELDGFVEVFRFGDFAGFVYEG